MSERVEVFPVALGAPAVVPRAIQERACGGRIRVEAVLESGEKFLDKEVTVCGWAKTVRKQGGGRVFIALNDGSTPETLQVIIETRKFEENDESMAHVGKAGVSFSFRIVGRVVKSPKEGQKYEMVLDDKEKHSIKIFGGADQAKYPLAKKTHSKEFLREIQHLRPRSYLQGCLARAQSTVAMAVHEFFQHRNFLNIHTPIITGADCEGGGELFQVTTLLPHSGKLVDIPHDPKTGAIDYKKDFFGKSVSLTCSGQLAAEPFACALGDVYAFGPTFRAENSHTTRHVAEFWMIEPEMAFADLEDNMECAESFVRYCVQCCLDRLPADIQWLENNVEAGLTERLKNIAENHFARCSYTEGIDILTEAVKADPTKFAADEAANENKIHWGMDLMSCHERHLSESHFKRPVIVYDYPCTLKPFYMKVNADKKTCRAMDVLVPVIGEVVGGSQREEDIEVLDQQMKDKKMDITPYWWYRELRQYGTVPHSGFGAGFERIVMMCTGIENIRDVSPYPRFPGNCEF